MKILQALILAFGFGSLSSYAQEVAIDKLPIATIDENYYVTLPISDEVEEFYYIDISKFTFSSEEEAQKVMNTYVLANLISNEVNYADKYMIIRIHVEHLKGDFRIESIQEYLGYLTKPKK